MSDCIEWEGAINSTGYGSVRVGGKTVGAHRLAYERAYGPIPDDVPGYHGMCVMHTCDNRRCVNPEHLKLGTHQDNMTDMYSKGRRPAPAGERNPSVKLTQEQVDYIRSSNKSLRALAAELGVTYGHIGKIRRGELWPVLAS